MKSATFPSLRVDPDLRQSAEDVLQAGESLSAFVEHAVRAQITLRQSQDAFVARGLASRDKAVATGQYLTSTTVLKTMESKLAKAKRSA